MTFNDDERTSEFERQTRALLEHSVTRIDGRVRSRLNQARHAALAAVERPRAPLWRGFPLAPAAGALAAIALAAVLWTDRPVQMLPINEGAHAAVEDLDLVADSDTLDLLQEDGGFYEWAVAQADAGQDASG